MRYYYIVHLHSSFWIQYISSFLFSEVLNKFPESESEMRPGLYVHNAMLVRTLVYQLNHPDDLQSLFRLQEIIDIEH